MAIAFFFPVSGARSLGFIPYLVGRSSRSILSLQAEFLLPTYTMTLN